MRRTAATPPARQRRSVMTPASSSIPFAFGAACVPALKNARILQRCDRLPPPARGRAVVLQDAVAGLQARSSAARSGFGLARRMFPRRRGWQSRRATSPFLRLAFAEQAAAGGQRSPITPRPGSSISSRERAKLITVISARLG